MAHDLQFVEVVGDNASFVCTTCGQPIMFNLPGVGEPAAVNTPQGYTPPENPDQWMSPCTT